MTPLVAEAHQNRKRFHAKIALKAKAVRPRLDRSYSIPNTPYGVPKIPPPVIVHVPMSQGMIEYQWRSMWFYDLIAAHIPDDAAPPKIERIQRAVARRYEISVMDLVSQRRTVRVAFPRQIAMYLAKTMTPRSFPEIGRRFGNRDHTTVIHAVRKIEGKIKTDPALAAEIDDLRREILA